MKEWCLKHPILTFLLLDELINAILNIGLKKRASKSVVDHVSGVVYEAADNINVKIKKRKRQPIGFRAS